jgi:hypothetical protein
MLQAHAEGHQKDCESDAAGDEPGPAWIPAQIAPADP